MKILPVGDEFFHADGQTDMTKLIVAFAMLRMRLNYAGMIKVKGGGLKHNFA